MTPHICRESSNTTSGPVLGDTDTKPYRSDWGSHLRLFERTDSRVPPDQAGVLEYVMSETIRRGELVIWIAVVLHLAQALGLLADARAGKATSLALLVAMTGARGAPLLLMGAALAAAVVLVFRRSTQRFALLFPQQAILCLAAGSVLIAVWASAYADLEPRPRPHIFVDQVIYPIMAIAHAIAMLRTSKAR